MQVCKLVRTEAAYGEVLSLWMAHQLMNAECFVDSSGDLLDFSTIGMIDLAVSLSSALWTVMGRRPNAS